MGGDTPPADVSVLMGDFEEIVVQAALTTNSIGINNFSNMEIPVGTPS